MRLFYKATDGTEIDFMSDVLWAEKPESLLAAAYSYTTSGTDKPKVDTIRRRAKEHKLNVAILADSEYEFAKIIANLADTFDKDIAANGMGRLYWDDFYRTVYGVSFECDQYDEDFCTTNMKLTFLSTDQRWVRETTQSLMAHSQMTADDGTDYPYDYPYDFAKPYMGRSSFENPSQVFASDFVMTIWGPCVNPTIKIGGHTYGLTGTLAAGEYVKVDSENLTVNKYGADGSNTNWINHRYKLESIFTRIEPGISRMEWDGSFGVDITLFEKKTLPFEATEGDEIPENAVILSDGSYLALSSGKYVVVRA